MASDSSRALYYGVRSAELRNDLGGEELQVVEVGHVEKLQVSPLYAGRDIWAELVRDLGGRAHQRGVAAQFVHLATDRGGAPRDIRVVAPRADNERRRIGQRVSGPYRRGQRVCDPLDLGLGHVQRRERDVEFGGELR